MQAESCTLEQGFEYKPLDASMFREEIPIVLVLTFTAFHQCRYIINMKQKRIKNLTSKALCKNIQGRLHKLCYLFCIVIIWGLDFISVCINSVPTQCCVQLKWRNSSNIKIIKCNPCLFGSLYNSYVPCEEYK